MSKKSEEFSEKFIQPVLTYFDLWSLSANNLLLGTSAQESNLGKYVMQIGGGGAAGPFQMEQATHKDCWRFIKAKPKIAEKMSSYFKLAEMPDYKLMITDWKYAAILARIKYLQIAQPLPSANDIAGLARYWKQYYNTYLGKGTEQQFMENYQRYVA